MFCQVKNEKKNTRNGNVEIKTNGKLKVSCFTVAILIKYFFLWNPDINNNKYTRAPNYCFVYQFLIEMVRHSMKYFSLSKKIKKNKNKGFLTSNLSLWAKCRDYFQSITLLNSGEGWQIYEKLWYCIQKLRFFLNNVNGPGSQAEAMVGRPFQNILNVQNLKSSI